MRRSPIACRRAVQSLQPAPTPHVWISDEQLSFAVHQFFRSTCPHQRRHGSHVPGPLEARRRAAKRRMTVSANFYPQDSLPPSFTLAALFGFRRDPHPSWRYEAPSLPRTIQPLDISPWDPTQGLDSILSSEPTTSNPTLEASGAPHSDTRSVAPAVWPGLETPASEDTTKEQNQVGHSAIDVAHISAQPIADAASNTMCFEDFKSRIAHARDLSDVDRNELLIQAFRASQPAYAGAWVYNVMVVKHLTQLGWDPSPFFTNTELSSFEIPPFYTQESLEFLQCAEKLSIYFPHRLNLLCRLYMKVAEGVLPTSNSTSSSQDAELLLLIRLMWQSASSIGEVLEPLHMVNDKLHDRQAVEILWNMLAQGKKLRHGIKCTISRAAEDHRQYCLAEQILRCVPQDQLSANIGAITLDLARSRPYITTIVQRSRLSTWLKLLHGFDNRTPPGRPGPNNVDTATAAIAKSVFGSRLQNNVSPKTLLYTLIFTLSQSDTRYAASTDGLLQLVDTCQSKSSQPEVLLARALTRIYKVLQPFVELTNAVTALIVHHAQLASVHNFLSVLAQNNLTLDDTSVFDNMLAQSMATVKHSDCALVEGDRQRVASTLRQCQAISEVLSRVTSSTAAGTLALQKDMLSTLQAQRQFEHILDRARAAHALPLAYRNITANIAMGTRASLIHQLAHQYTLDNTRSHRETWRAMYYLYCYLQRNSLAIGPLFSKAVVRICIILPLSEGRFVSARRLIWVCHLVARVEGEEVARKVETNFWLWRGDLFKHAKSVFVGIGGDRKAKAHVGTMKRLGLI